MNYKTVQRVSQLYAELQKLDAEIIAIDKMALYVSEHPATLKLRLTGEKAPQDNKQNVLDADGDLINQQPGESTANYMHSLYDSLMARALYGVGTTINKSSSDFDLSYDISDSVCLGILGVLLSEKHNRRQTITDELKTIFHKA